MSERSAPTVLQALASLPAELRESLAPPDPGLPLDVRRAVIRAQLERVHTDLVSPLPGVVDGCTVEDVQVGPVHLRVYRPVVRDDAPRPAFVFVHGGGWWQGSVDSSVIDLTCRERCVSAACVVVSVGYRKAPEHRHPLPVDDVLSALRWTHAHAAALDIDVRRIGIGGQSAGANLVAAAVLRNRDEGGPPVSMQVLEVPVLDLTLERAAARATPEELEGLRECVDLYLDDPAAAVLPYVSPLLAPDVSGLPSTHIMVAGLDPLRDDGCLYAARLLDAGVGASVSTYSQHVHGSLILTSLPEARRWRDEVLEVTARLLGPTA